MGFKCAICQMEAFCLFDLRSVNTYAHRFIYQEMPFKIIFVHFYILKQVF